MVIPGGGQGEEAGTRLVGGGLDGAGSTEWLVASREEGDDGGGMVGSNGLEGVVVKWLGQDRADAVQCPCA